MRTTIARSDVQAGRRVLTVIVVGLTLVTAAIHLSLGGLLFTLNAIGYATLALGLVVPGPVARMRWLVRLALLGFTLATILGWIAFGARFPMAYLDKSIEAVLVAFVAADIRLSDGSPIQIARRLLGLPSAVAHALRKVDRP